MKRSIRPERAALAAFLVPLLLVPPSTEVAAQGPVQETVGNAAGSEFQGSGVFFGAGAGLAMGTLSVGGDSGDNASGLVYSLSVGTTRNGYRRWMLDFQGHPFDVPSPLIDEALRSWNLLVGFSLGSRGFLVPRIGVQRRSWSGPERVEDSDLGLAVGLGAGVQKRFGSGWLLAPEAFWLWSGVELEGSVSTSVLGVRISAVRISRSS